MPEKSNSFCLSLQSMKHIPKIRSTYLKKALFFHLIIIQGIFDLRIKSNSYNQLRIYRVCHRFSLMKRDDCFRVDSDHF